MKTAALALGSVLLLVIGGGTEAWAQQGGQGGGGADPRQVVLSTMHQMNQLEMALGQIAQARAERDDVQAYGERLFRDHRFADARVERLAARLGFELLPPPQLPAAQQLRNLRQQAQQLQQASGEEFDRMFLQLMVRSHEMATRMLSDALGRLPPGAVQTLVSRLLPILGQHLELARQLQTRGDLVADANSNPGSG